jgi:hypothetical protein
MALDVESVLDDGVNGQEALLRRRPLGALRDRTARALASRQAIERPPSARGLFRDLPLADADEGPERERGDEVEQE